MCGCSAKRNNGQPAISGNRVIRRISPDPWVTVKLIDESVVTLTKIFSGNNNVGGQYLGKHKYNDVFRAPVSVLAQTKRFIKHDDL